MCRYRVHWSVVIVVWLLPFTASAGMLIVGKSTDADTPGVAESGKIQIDRGRLRVDGEGETVIFRGDRGVMWFIDSTEKTYTEMTREELERMAKGMASEFEQLRARMQQLPPEQRKAIEAMMPRGGPLTSALTYRKVRSGATVGRWTCDVYEGHRGGARVAEVCVASPQQLGMSAEDFRTLRQFGELVGGMASKLGGASWIAGVEDPQKGGFPGVMVRGVIYDKGRPDSAWEITDARSQGFADSLFEVPAGFTKSTR